MRLSVRLPLFIIGAAIAVATVVPLPATQLGGRSYLAYVCAESDDTVALVRFAPSGPGRAPSRC